MRRKFKLHVGVYPINVEIVPDKWLHDQNTLYGAYDEPNRIIFLSDALKGIEKQEVFLHELIHGVSHLYNLDLSETQVSVLGMGLVQALKPYLKPIK